MSLPDLPKIVQHGYKWAYALCFGTKWKQVFGVPQGIQFGVGVATLVTQKCEHETYERDPELRRRFQRARCLDDSLL